MAGSPAQEAAAHQSRKRRASQITPDKSKKSTVSMSPASAETNSNKPARMAPVNPKGSAKSATSVTDKLPTTIDKAEGSGDGSVNPKSAKSDLAGKAKNKSEKVTAKNNKTDEKEKPAAKKDDNKDKGKEKAVDKAVEKAMEKAKETKVDAKDKATKGKVLYHPPTSAYSLDLSLRYQLLTCTSTFQPLRPPSLIRESSFLTLSSPCHPTLRTLLMRTPMTPTPLTLMTLATHAAPTPHPTPAIPTTTLTPTTIWKMTCTMPWTSTQPKSML